MAAPNTLKGAKLYICTTAQSGALDAAAFAALTWVEIKKVGKIGGVSTATRVTSYAALGDEVDQKGKGGTDGGDWTVEMARVYNDAGQVALRAAATPSNDGEYAFKVEYEDAPASGYTNTITYNKGVVTGPERPGEGKEDFILEVFTLHMNQLNVTVEPTNS